MKSSTCVFFLSSILLSGPLFGAQAKERNLHFLAHKGRVKEALSLYAKRAENQEHDPDLLRELCWKSIEESLESADPKQLPLAMFGALIADDERALPFFRKAAANANPLVALLGIHGLFTTSKKEAAFWIEKVTSSDFLPLQFEAVHLLSQLDPKKAIRHIEALFYKLPEELLPLLAQLLFPLDTKDSARFIKKLLVHPKIPVRLAAAALAAAKPSEELLPFLKNMLSRFDAREKEAAILALERLQDTNSLPEFKKTLRSRHRFVSFASKRALENLGTPTEDLDYKEDPFYISLLEKGDDTDLKMALFSSKLGLKANAALTYLKRRKLTKEALELLTSRKYAFEKKYSPARSLTCWQPIAYDPILSALFRAEVLSYAFFLDDSDLYIVGNALIASRDGDLLPLFIRRIVHERRDLAEKFLKKYMDRPGDPFVRGWALWGLAALGHEGKTEDLALWVRETAEKILLDPETLLSMEKKMASRTDIQDDENTWLFFSSLELIAEEGDLDTLLHCLLSCHESNSPVIAAIILQATL